MKWILQLFKKGLKTLVLIKPIHWFYSEIAAGEWKIFVGKSFKKKAIYSTFNQCWNGQLKYFPHNFIRKQIQKNEKNFSWFSGCGKFHLYAMTYFICLSYADNSVAGACCTMDCSRASIFPQKI